MQLNLELAQEIAKAVRKKAGELGINLTVSVVDNAGRLILTMRGDGTGFLSPDISRGKAAASAAFGLTTKQMVEMQKTNPAFWNALPTFASGIMPTTGAVPIKYDGKVIGAVGCSGATADQDHECALAGAEIVGELVDN